MTTKFKVLISAVIICSAAGTDPAFSQQTNIIKKEVATYPVRGIVTNSLGLPLRGASVVISGTQNGTFTDSSGQFILEYVANKTMVSISFTGYKTVEIKTEKSTFFNIQLQIEARNINEVNILSTGYQDLPKERATGAFTKINRDLINQQVGPDIISRFKDVTSSVLFSSQGGDVPAFTIRGVSSINGNKSPLIVLNNFPYEGSLSSINPNDIESATFLKDAAATSIWGTSAGNGVIVINTRKGKYNEQLKVELSTNFTFGRKPDFGYLNTMATTDFIDVEKMLFAKGYYDSQITDFQYPEVSPVVETLLKVNSNEITGQQGDALINALRNLDVRDQYNNYLYKQLLNQQYALSMRGGSSNYAYYASVGFDRNRDNIQARFDRINFRLDNDFKLSKNLKARASVFYSQTKNTSGAPAYGSILLGNGINQIYPYAQFMDQQSNALALNVYRKAFTDTIAGGRLQDWAMYPANDWRNNQQTLKSTELNTNIDLNYHLPLGLNLSVKYSYERQQGIQDQLMNPESFYTRNLINTYSQIDPYTNNIVKIIPDGSILDRSNMLMESQNLRGQVDYSRTIKHHGIIALIGAELRSISNSSNTNRSYGYNPDRLTVANIDFLNFYPSIVTGWTNQIPNQQGFINTTNRYTSVFGNVAYTYKEKYTVSGSARRDGSNLFGVSTNNKFKPLWSAGMSWNLGEERFYHFSLLPDLKLRTTFGFSGNVNPNLSGLTTLIYSPSLAQFTNQPYAGIDKFENPDLRWEKIGQFNVGVDFVSRGRVISGSVDYYVKNGKDLYGPALVDYTSGIRQYTFLKNTASMRGFGLDVVLNSVNIDRTFKWKTTLLYNYNKSKITDYYSPVDVGSSFISIGQTISGLVGKPLYAIVTYSSPGLNAEGNPIGYVDGHESTDYSLITGKGTKVNDLIVRGSALPTSFGSVINTFLFKGIELNINISYKLGYYFLRPSINYTNLFVSRLGNGDYAQRWQKAGDEKHTNVPALIYPNDNARDNFYNNSEVLVEKGDHIRLQYINLAYTLPASVLRKAGIAGVQFYLNAANLPIIWRANKSGIDPDYYNNAFIMPTPAAYSVGARLNF